MAAEYGRMISSVSRLSGTSGSRKTGSVDGSSPMSPTVRRSSPKPIEIALSTTMQTSGDGTILVSRGSR